MANDFSSQYIELKREIDAAVERVLMSGWYILGKEVVAFEEELAKFVGVKYAVGVASGSDALTISLKALGLGKNDGVIIPANVYPTIFGIAKAGVDIQLADVDPLTLNINLENIKKTVTKKTKAIVVVHLYGNPVDITPIKKFAKEKKLYLIEDCAQAIGAIYKDRLVGSFGDVSCFSFYPTKNLGAIGDGGAILTNNKKLFERIKMWRMYGERERYNSEFIGYNSRLDELQAAILRVKLRKVKEWNLKRRKIAERYKEELKDKSVNLLNESPNSKSCFHLFVIKSNDRDKLKKKIESSGFPVGIHYPVPIHLVKSFKYLGFKKREISSKRRSF